MECFFFKQSAHLLDLNNVIMEGDGTWKVVVQLVFVQGDQKVSVHLAICIVIIRCTETF